MKLISKMLCDAGRKLLVRTCGCPYDISVVCRVECAALCCHSEVRLSNLVVTIVP